MDKKLMEKEGAELASKILLDLREKFFGEGTAYRDLVKHVMELTEGYTQPRRTKGNRILFGKTPRVWSVPERTARVGNLINAAYHFGGAEHIPFSQTPTAPFKEALKKGEKAFRTNGSEPPHHIAKLTNSAYLSLVAPTKLLVATTRGEALKYLYRVKLFYYLLMKQDISAENDGTRIELPWGAYRNLRNEPEKLWITPTSISYLIFTWISRRAQRAPEQNTALYVVPKMFEAWRASVRDLEYNCDELVSLNPQRLTNLMRARPTKTVRKKAGTVMALTMGSLAVLGTAPGVVGGIAVAGGLMGTAVGMGAIDTTWLSINRTMFGLHSNGNNNADTFAFHDIDPEKDYKIQGRWAKKKGFLLDNMAESFAEKDGDMDYILDGELRTSDRNTRASHITTRLVAATAEYEWMSEEYKRQSIQILKGWSALVGSTTKDVGAANDTKKLRESLGALKDKLDFYATNETSPFLSAPTAKPS